MTGYNQKPKIVISEELKEKLNKLGSKGDTYEDIIKRMIEHENRLEKDEKYKPTKETNRAGN